MRTLKHWVTAAILASMASWGVAQAARPSVYLDYEGHDIVGQTVAYDLREDIARSASFAPTGDVRNAGIVVYMTSVDDAPLSMPGASTAIGVAFVGPDSYFIGEDVHTCPAYRATDCARAIIAALANALYGSE